MKKKIFFKNIYISKWGWSGVVVSENGLYKIFLPHPEKVMLQKSLIDLGKNFALKESDEMCNFYINFIKDYFDKKQSRFNLKIDWSIVTSFQREVYDICMKIPYGQVRSYWWIAVRMGNPSYARAVGGAMAINPFPIIVPCHRVVRSGGTLGGFSSGLELKIALLEHEGIDTVKLFRNYKNA